MNSQIADEVFISPIAASNASATASTGQTAFKLAVVANMLRSIKGGTYTAITPLNTYTAADTLAALIGPSFTASPSGAVSSADTQYVVRLLNTAGYTAKVIGTNLVVSW